MGPIEQGMQFAQEDWDLLRINLQQCDTFAFDHRSDTGHEVDSKHVHGVRHGGQ